MWQLAAVCLITMEKKVSSEASPFQVGVCVTFGGPASSYAENDEARIERRSFPRWSLGEKARYSVTQPAQAILRAQERSRSAAYLLPGETISWVLSDSQKGKIAWILLPQ